MSYIILKKKIISIPFKNDIDLDKMLHFSIYLFILIIELSYLIALGSNLLVLHQNLQILIFRSRNLHFVGNLAALGENHSIFLLIFT